jgi:hypothetical protein
MASEPQARIFGFDRKLYPNISGVFGIQDVRTLNALYVSRYVSFVQEFIGQWGDRFTGDLTAPQQIETNPMFDLLGVRYVLTGMTRLDTTSGAAGEQYRLVGTTGGVSVYENQHRTPRAFVVGKVHVAPTGAAAISYLKGLGHALPDGTTRLDSFDPTRQAVVEEPRGTAEAPAADSGSLSRKAAIVSYEPDQVVIDVPAGGPGLLVLTDTYMPGWHATVNGKPASVVPADVAFRGVSLGSEAAHVVLRYRAPHESLIWILPLAGAVGLLALALLRRVRAAR